MKRYFILNLPWWLSTNDVFAIYFLDIKTCFKFCLLFSTCVIKHETRKLQFKSGILSDILST